MKHKVLFISSWFPNKLEPTNGNFVQRHAEAVSLICDVEILHAIGNFQQSKKFIFDDQIINNIRTLIVYYKNSKNPLQNFYRRMIAYKKGFHQLQYPDLIHANVLHNSMFFAVYLKKKFKIPFVISEHWSALKTVNQHKTSFVIKLVARLIGNQACKILPVTKNLQESLEKLGIRTSMEIVPNVVNTSLFFPAKKSTEKFTFIHVSNLTANKSADKILNVAIKLLKEGYSFKLQIGGDGDTSELEKIVKNENLESVIEIFGIQTLPQIAERMQRSDCFILFSDYENQPCVIAESFASGIRVISTNVGGISEFFPDDFGILLENKEEDLLKDAMLKMLMSEKKPDPSTLKIYAEKTFSQETISEKFLKIYNETLK